MMYDHEKSDPAIVAVKPTNKAGQPAAELAEPRAGAEGNVSQQSTGRAQYRGTVSQALERIRQAARQRKKEKFTALFHYVSIDHLAEAFSELKGNAAAGVDGLTCRDYEQHLERNLEDLHARIHRIVRAASGPEPIRKPEELFLVDRAQHRSRGPLDDLVFKGGDRDRALPTIRLGYVNPPRRSCPIRSPMDTSVQILKIALKVLLVIPTCQPIHSSCSILLEFRECLCEVINTDVMEERGELLLLPLPCGLPYALQRL